MLGVVVSWDPEDSCLQKHVKDLELNQVTDTTRLSQTCGGSILGQHSNMLAGSQVLQGTKSQLEFAKGHPTLRDGEGDYLLLLLYYMSFSIAISMLFWLIYVCIAHAPDPRRVAKQGNVSQPCVLATLTIAFCTEP